jgi:hypothetical protein
MLLAVNASGFPFFNGGHEVTSLALKLKLVARGGNGLAFLAPNMVSAAHMGT